MTTHLTPIGLSAVALPRDQPPRVTSSVPMLAIAALHELSRRERKALTEKLGLAGQCGMMTAAHNGPGARDWDTWTTRVVGMLAVRGVIGGAS